MAFPLPLGGLAMNRLMDVFWVFPWTVAVIVATPFNGTTGVFPKVTKTLTGTVPTEVNCSTTGQ